MVCPECNSNKWIQQNQNQIRTLIFVRGHISLLGPWESGSPKEPETMEDCFQCKKCGFVAKRKEINESLFFQLLHSHPKLSEGPGRIIDRRRSEDRKTQLERHFLKPLQCSPVPVWQFRVVKNELPNTGLKIEDSLELGNSIFVPLCLKAHTLWLRSGNSGMIADKKDLRIGPDFTSFNKETGRRIVEEVCSIQIDFIVNQNSALLPFSQADIAEKTGFDSSTVSRLVGAITIQIQDGSILHLENLLSPPLGKEAPESNLSRDRILNIMTAIVRSSDSKLSDQAISNSFASEFNIKIARRTINKYRHELLQLTRSQNSVLISGISKTMLSEEAKHHLSAFLRDRFVTGMDYFMGLSDAQKEAIYSHADSFTKTLLALAYCNCSIGLEQDLDLNQSKKVV